MKNEGKKKAPTSVGALNTEQEIKMNNTTNHHELNEGVIIHA